MRLQRILVTPWVAAPRSSRWLVALVLALAALVDVLGRFYVRPERVWTLDAAMLGIGNAACWLLLLPNGLLLALDARRMRLPGVSRDVSWSLPLYAALTIGTPLLCQSPQDHVLSFAVVQVCVGVGAMLFMMMPAYVGIAICVLPVLFNSVRHDFSLPAPSDPRFVPWGSALAVATMVILVWRWRQLLRGRHLAQGLRAPNLIRLRQNFGRTQSDPLTDPRALRARPGWLIARPDLGDAGPSAVTRALRIALGGVYLPQTIVSHLCQWVLALAFLLPGALIFFFGLHDDHGASRALHYLFSREGFTAAAWLLAMFSFLLVMMPT